MNTSTNRKSVKERKLLFSIGIKDCNVETFSVGGAGGSGKDTSNTGVRITHVASGASGRATESRSQRQNKEAAFRRMGESKEFQAWAKKRAAQIARQPSINEVVEKQMSLENIRVETETNQGWKEEKE